MNITLNTIIYFYNTNGNAHKNNYLSLTDISSFFIHTNGFWKHCSLYYTKKLKLKINKGPDWPGWNL